MRRTGIMAALALTLVACGPPADQDLTVGTLERDRIEIQAESWETLVEQGMDFEAALELVSASNVFTTHTPVPAGHDIFDKHLMKEYFVDCLDRMKMDFDEFMQLGSSPNAEHSFNMTALALRGSRFHNGVSRIHGSVASDMESYVWPEIPYHENPITYVTNGVHAPTFLAREWINLFDMRFSVWRNQLLNRSYWKRIDDIPDHRFWSLRQELKAQMLENMHALTMSRYKKNQANDALIKRITSIIGNPEADVLVLGFARRFATYKRATLLFKDAERLARLLNDPERPVVLMFAGKAHPNDEPGQDLIRTIHNYAHRPEFQGKIILLEDYNMAMARSLVTGVDVWINTPQYPLEACGTSGMKAAINGVINLSVLDGWWAEAWDGKNGWAITPHPEFDPQTREQLEAEELLNILEYQVIPTYYARNEDGEPEAWITTSKASMKSVLPRFNTIRMAKDYLREQGIEHGGIAAIGQMHPDAAGGGDPRRRQLGGHAAGRKLVALAPGQGGHTLERIFFHDLLNTAGGPATGAAAQAVPVLAPISL